MMLINLYKSKSIPGIALVAMVFLIAGCNADTKVFDSGLANEWSGKDSVSRESLVMQPSYYFRGLGNDLGFIAWLAVPRGKLFRDASKAYKIEEIRGVLVSYIDLLGSLPNGNELPEYKLANIYLDIATGYIASQDSKQSMLGVANKLVSMNAEIKHLESQLYEADNRRWTVLMQAFPRYALFNTVRQEGYIYAQAEDAGLQQVSH